MNDNIRKTAEAILAFQDDWHKPIWGDVNIPDLKALARAYLDFTGDDAIAKAERAGRNLGEVVVKIVRQRDDLVEAAKAVLANADNEDGVFAHLEPLEAAIRRAEAQPVSEEGI